MVSPVNFGKTHFEAEKELVQRTKNKDLRRTESWYPLGPFGKERLAGAGRVNTMQFHPTDTNTWFICVAQGGVWRTTNAGKSWISITNNLPIERTSYLSIHPTNPDTMYLALGDYAYLGHNLIANENKRNSHYGMGVYKTLNGGTTWEPTGLSFKQLDYEGSLIAKILVHPTHPDTLIAVGQTGSYVSKDGGTNWQKTSSHLFWDLEQFDSNPNALMATTGFVWSYGYGQAGVLKSSDFGLTWTESSINIPKSGSVQRLELAIAPSDNNTMYVIACDSIGGFYGFYKSVDAGSIFNKVIDANYPYNLLNNSLDNAPGGQGSYDMAICVDRSDKNKVTVGGINIWQTLDAGNSFLPVTYWRLNYVGKSLHADVHEIRQHPSNGSYFACHDGGLSRTFSVIQDQISSLKDIFEAEPKTVWTNYTEGLNITAFYRLSISKSTHHIIAGAQDNSTVIKLDNSFSNISGGDGMESSFIEQESQAYTSSQNGVLYNYRIIDDSVFNYVGQIRPPGRERGEWTTPFLKDNGILYVGYGNLHEVFEDQLINQITNFNNAPQRNYPKPITALALTDTLEKTRYLAKRGYNSQNIKSEVWVSEAGGAWEERGTNLPDSLYPTYMYLNRNNPKEVWLCYAGFDAKNKIYHSIDAGKTWKNITYDLINTSVNCIIHQHDSTNLVYVATDLGVFYKEQDSNKWIPFNTNLPRVIVSELEIDYKNHVLNAATFGRGLWAVDLPKYRDFINSTQALNINLNLKIGPNPTPGVLQVFCKEEVQELNVKVLDITGRTVLTQKLNTKLKRSSIDLTHLSTGEYFLSFESKDGSRTVKKVIKKD